VELRKIRSGSRLGFRRIARNSKLLASSATLTQIEYPILNPDGERTPGGKNAWGTLTISFPEDSAAIFPPLNGDHLSINIGIVGKVLCPRDFLPPVLDRLGIEPTLWSALVRDFGRPFMNVAGTAKSVSEARSRKTHRKFYRPRVLTTLPSPNSKMCLLVGMQATVVACANFE